MSRLILSLFILIISPINAIAVEINDAGANKLKTSFQNLLDYQKEVNEAFGTSQMFYEGEIKVVQEEEFYAITLPYIKTKSSNGVVLDLGVINLTMTPNEKSNYWNASLNHPLRISMINETSGNTITLNFSSQNASALFNDHLGYFTKLDINLSDISINDGKKDLPINIDNLQFYSDLEEGTDGKFSGMGHLIARGLNAATDGKASLKLGEAKFGFYMDNIKLPTIASYQEKILKHLTTLQSLNKTEGKDSSESDTETVNTKNTMDMIFDLYDFDMEGFSFEYSLKDLEIQKNDKKELVKAKNLKIAAAFFGIGFDGLKQDKGSFNIKSGFDGIDIKPNDPEYNKTIPQTLNIDIAAENIPYKTLTGIAKTSAKSIAENPEGASMVGLGLMMRLPAILSQSGTKLVVKNSGIKNDIYNIDVNGEIITDLTAIMGFSAKFITMFDGLDALLSVAQKQAANPDSKYKSDFKDMEKTLLKAKELGVKDGNSYSYVLETTPEGKFLLNGQDSSTIKY